MTNRNARTPAQNLCNAERPDAEPISRRQALKTLPQVVYAARVGESIKIGCSEHLDQRLRILQSVEGEPVELLGFIPGGFEDEAALHSRLAEHRARGREFYHASPDVLAAVNAMRTALNLPHIAA